MSLSESFKVVLLGDARVGKTSIMVRYTRNTYSDQQPSSKPPRPEGPCATKKLRVASTLVELSLWDTAGQEEYHALAPMYYRDASSAVLVYDITDTDSYNKVKKWVKELRKVVDDNIPIAIVGNKIDLERNRHVNAKEAVAYAASIGAAHFHASAKTNQGVEEIFNDLTAKMIEKRPAARQRPSSGRMKLVIAEDEPASVSKSSSGCCGICPPSSSAAADIKDITPSSTQSVLMSSYKQHLIPF